MTGRDAKPVGPAGFSLIEMLMATTILAFGLLGLAMLETMGIRVARGGKNLNMAVHIAQRVMDQIELEGRLSWLNLTDSSYTSPASLSQLKYVGQGTVYMGFDATGTATATAPLSAKPTAFFVMTTSEAVVATATTGTLADYTVQVQFADGTGASTRTVTLSRRILHG